MDEKDKIIGYDMHVRYLISYVQAFINNQRDPEFFGAPDLTLATKTWQAANDYNANEADAKSCEACENYQSCPGPNLVPDDWDCFLRR